MGQILKISNTFAPKWDNFKNTLGAAANFELCDY